MGHWQIKLPRIFLTPKHKNLMLCDFLALYILNQLMNNFDLKIINFQSLAFNGLSYFCVPFLIIPSTPATSGKVFVYIFHILTILFQDLYICFSRNIDIWWHTHISQLSRFVLIFLDCYVWPGLPCLVLSVVMGKSQRMVTFGLSTTVKGLSSYCLLGVS